MMTTLILTSLAGSFALARFYGLGGALAALGLSWAIFAWFPQMIPTAAPILVAVIVGLLAIGLLRDRRRGTGESGSRSGGIT